MSKKVKVSNEIGNFIQSYEDNVNGYPGWEDIFIMEHSRAYFDNFEGAKIESLCMKDITPMELAKILIYGYETE